MLSIVDIVQPEDNRGLRERWRRLVKPAISAYMRPAGNTHYLRIICEQRNGRIDWRGIRSYSLDCLDRVVLPVEVQLPEGIELRRFVPYAFNRRMLENLALDILAHSAVRPELRRVAIYGQDSEVESLLPRLCSFAGEVRVITRRPHAVADTVEHLRAGYGAAISVSDCFDACGFDVLLAPAGGAPVFAVDSGTIVLAPDRPKVDAGLWIRAAKPPLPEMLSSEYDDRYDLNEFVGAFYEAGEIRELGRLMPVVGVTESGGIIPAQAAELISR